MNIQESKRTVTKKVSSKIKIIEQDTDANHEKIILLTEPSIEEQFYEESEESVREVRNSGDNTVVPKGSPRKSEG